MKNGIYSLFLFYLSMLLGACDKHRKFFTIKAQLIYTCNGDAARNKKVTIYRTKVSFPPTTETLSEGFTDSNGYVVLENMPLNHYRRWNIEVDGDEWEVKGLSSKPNKGDTVDLGQLYRSPEMHTNIQLQTSGNWSINDTLYLGPTIYKPIIIHPITDSVIHHIFKDYSQFPDLPYHSGIVTMYWGIGKADFSTLFQQEKPYNFESRKVNIYTRSCQIPPVPTIIQINQ